tara:strand:- start:346 stop:522 length:177 start_codon:yes stop_codon:yes gene_type:complete
VTYKNKGCDQKHLKYLAAPAVYKKEKLKKDLKSAYPDIKNVTLKKGKRPAGWSLFASA